MNVSQLAQTLGLTGLDADLVRVSELLRTEIALGNAELADPGRRVIDGGGKRLRPILVMAAATAVGGSVDDDVVRGATALELVHVGSLVHDDIIDHADTRRSVPTINSVEGPAHALLVGDFLLARAGYLASLISQDVATSLAIAISELCVGQSLETSSIGDPQRSIDSYLASINGKTASLIRAACRIGAQAARADASVVAALAEFGTNFGHAFQIVDDILDVVATSEALGKPAGHDTLEGVFNLPVLLHFAQEGGPQPGFDHRDADVVSSLLDDVRSSGALDSAIELAVDYAARAADAVSSLPSNATLDGLAGLPRWYVDDQLAPYRPVVPAAPVAPAAGD